ncbi:MAG: F0F1 ATP synthase subunit delta [Propionivibrio sp.]|nr:F0F1 ATP synthase subunit delta [Propionivibrio sp.]
MLIDWFTVGAQVINFLILIWLMKRYLYQPILRAIDAREERVAAELSDADAKKAEAKKERDEFEHKNEAFDKQRTELLSKARDEASAKGQQLMDAARQAADALSVKRQKALNHEQQILKEAISQRTREEVFAITRKALTDLADTTLEASMTEAFTRRVRALTGKDKELLDAALKNSSKPTIIRSAFALPQEQHAAIQLALNETFSADIKIDYVVKPDVISGIELTAAGQKIAWSIADYLSSMEQRIGELTKVQDAKNPSATETGVAALPAAKVESKQEAKSRKGTKHAIKPATSGNPE